MIKIGPKQNRQNVTPSTRDLARFISPNPNATSKILWFCEKSGDDLKAQEEKFAEWENKNPAAVVIDCLEYPYLKDATYLSALSAAVSCPILKYQRLASDDDIFDTRVLGFDGQISPLEDGDKKNFFEIFKLAQSIHFRVIPAVQKKQDWDIVATASPQFIYLEPGYTDELPPLVRNSRMNLIGNTDQSQAFKLKCLVEKL